MPQLKLRTFALALMGTIAALAAGDRSTRAELPAVSGSNAYERLLRVVEGRDGKPAPRNLLQLIPRLDPELRSNFTFVYESRSPHAEAATPLFPRTVLFTRDARLLIAFTGDPAKPGYDVLETIRFDDRQASFVTSRFVLPDAEARDAALAPLARQNGAPNRPECTRCHGEDPRPIFDSYNVWPGFYGSIADEPGLIPKELAGYRRFMSRSRGRADLPYKLLAWPKRPSAVHPYTASNGRKPKSLGAPSQLNRLPNTRLGMALTELNRARLFRKLRAAPAYSKARFALIAGLAGCAELPISKTFRQEILVRAASENEHKLMRAGVDPASDLGAILEMQELREDFLANLEELAYLAAYLKISRADWSMALEPEALSFFDGILSGIANNRSYYLKEDFLLGMLGELAEEDPAFEEYFDQFQPYASAGFVFGNRLDLLKFAGSKQFCRLLTERAQAAGITAASLPEAPASWLDPSPFAEEAPPAKGAALDPFPNPFQRCIHCHKSTAAPAIPFDDLSALKTGLSAQASSGLRTLRAELLDRIREGSRKPMPLPPARLPTQERETMERWLDQVK